MPPIVHYFFLIDGSGNDSLTLANPRGIVLGGAFYFTVNRRGLIPRARNRRAEPRSERRGDTEENAIPRSIKKTAIAFALAGLKALSKFLGLFSRFLFLLLAMPLLFLSRQLVRPILLMLYRSTFPVRLALRKIIAPAKSALVYPLTTRSIAHIVIGLVTVIVTTNSLTAKELKTTSDHQGSLLANFVIAENDEPLTVIRPQHEAMAPVSVSDGVLAKSDAVVPAEEGEAAANDTALEKPLLSATVASGTPRQDVVKYTVQGGDTISTIAEEYGISQSSLLWANGLSETNFIKPGQELNVPPVSGVLHVVKRGDTVNAIASKYRASPDSVLEFNLLADAGAIEEGQTLVVPGGTIEAPPPAPSSAGQFRPDQGSGTPPPSIQPTGGGYLWPTPSRRINRGYLAYHPALDIEGDIGSPVYAAADGVVEAVNYIRYGYGYHVIINHGGGRKTLYAHNARMFVKPGQSVSKGQTISVVGMTGRTTGPHLHFELFVNGVKVNPLGYLKR